MRLHRGCLLAFAGLWVACSWPAAARDLTLEEAVSRSLAEHPVLRAQGATITATEREAELTALAPPLVVGGELENVAGTGSLSSADGAETTVRLSRVIELGGKRQARVASGQARVARERHGIEILQIEVAAETTRRFVEVLADQARLDVARAEVARAERTLAGVGRTVDTARSPKSDRDQAEIALGRSRLAQEDAEHELLTARQALSALWGRREPDFTIVRGDLDTLPPIEPLEALVARLPDSADQQRYDREAEILQAERRAASAAVRPDVALSMGVRRLESVDDEALVFGVSVPLGSTRRSTLSSARVDAELEAVAARRAAAEQDAQQRLFALYQELLHARHVVAAHGDELIPRAERVLEANRRAWELGQSGIFLLAQSEQQLTELHAARIEAAARYHLLLVDIERLTAARGVATP